MKIQDNLLDTTSNDFSLDFLQIKRCIKLPTGKMLQGEEAVRASTLSLKLKNVILQQVMKLRETRKVPKLKDILKAAIDQRNRE